MKDILILGKEGNDCDDMESVVRQACAALDCEFTLRRVDNDIEIMTYGVNLTPALVINDGVRIMGRVPDIEEAKSIIDMVQ